MVRIINTRIEKTYRLNDRTLGDKVPRGSARMDVEKEIAPVKCLVSGNGEVLLLRFKDDGEDCVKESPNFRIADLEINEIIVFGGGDAQEVMEERSVVIRI